MRLASIIALLAVAGCGSTAPVSSSDDEAMAAATRKAVADTDGALRDAAAPPAGRPQVARNVEQTRD